MDLLKGLHPIASGVKLTKHFSQILYIYIKANMPLVRKPNKQLLFMNHISSLRDICKEQTI